MCGSQTYGRIPAMQLTYDLEQKDFYYSFVAHRERTAVLKWSYRLLCGFIFLLPSIGLLTLATDPHTKFVTIVPLFVLAVFWAILIWGAPWWSAHSQYLQQPAAQGSRTMTLDGSGIHWQWKGGQADVEWTNFIRFLESKTAFLLYTSPACFNVVPKRAFAAGETESFRDLLQEKLGGAAAAHGRRISPRVLVFLAVVAWAFVLLLITIIRNSR